MEITSIAGFWRRLAAFVIDCLILGVPAMLAGVALFRWVASLGSAGRLIGFVVALLYFGLLDSRLGGGQTLGKKLFGIRVIDRDGNALSPMRSVLRFLVIAIPYFLNKVGFDVDPVSAGGILLAYFLNFVVFGGLGAIVYLFIFNRRTRQSLHDLAVGSFVVRGPRAPIPIGLFTPHLHLIVVGLWLALALIAPGAIPDWVAHEPGVAESIKPLVELQDAIKKRLDLRLVSVTMGKSSTAVIGTGGTGTSTTSLLTVDAQLNHWNDDEFEALLPNIAGIVLNLHSDLLGNDQLVVKVTRGFDLGIANFSDIRRERLDAAAWRANLSSVNFRPRPGVALCLYMFLCFAENNSE